MGNGSTTRDELFEAGMAVRTEVLGEGYVSRAKANTNEFTADMQRLVAEYCWGAVWTRDGLSRRERSILNLGMLSGLNRPHELAIHIRGALNNGITKDEIREALLQVAIYAGVPAALDGFRTAQEVFATIEAEGGHLD